MRRRSTMVSASSDIASLLGSSPRSDSGGDRCRAPDRDRFNGAHRQPATHCCRKWTRTPPPESVELYSFFSPGFSVAALERGAENVAERRARIGGAVLGDRLLLLGDFERLDRDLHLVGAAVELGDAGVDLLADREALRPLLAAVARQLRALDEGR